jgi:hypothetical protein
LIRMSGVDRLFKQYVAEHRAGGTADPLQYLERVRGADRLELEALIDGYLTNAAPQERGAESYRGSLAEQVVESLSPSIAGSSGLWPTVLPGLRNRAQVRRSELVHRLAQTLEVGDREAKVADYYNQMEQGLLPAEGVSTRVLAALGEIVGRSAPYLRRLGRALGPAAEQPPGSAAAFARLAAPAAPAGDEAHERPAPTSAMPEWDEVDELFRGGG